MIMYAEFFVVRSVCFCGMEGCTTKNDGAVASASKHTGGDIGGDVAVSGTGTKVGGMRLFWVALGHTLGFELAL